MHLRRPLVLLAILGALLPGPLVACSGTPDVDRGEQNCTAQQGGDDASDPSCENSEPTEENG